MKPKEQCDAELENLITAMVAAGYSEDEAIKTLAEIFQEQQEKTLRAMVPVNNLVH